jgi:hypothetical protein
MSKEMKAIMENWDRFVIEEATAGDYLDKIKRDLYIIAAKQAGSDALKTVVSEFGEDIVNASLDALGAVPGIGNVTSGLRSLWTAGKIAKKGFEVVKNTKELLQPTRKVLQIAAGEYIGQGANDDEANKSYIGKLLNIDDPTEEVTDEEHLNRFASLLINDLATNREAEIDNVDRYAEEKLANYLVNLRAYKKVEPN